MSQAKVDRYKEEKKNRAKIIKKGEAAASGDEIRCISSGSCTGCVV